MTFVHVTDELLGANVGLQEIAEALGVSYSTVRATRLPESSPSRRNPPAGWERALAKLARERGRKLEALARALEGVAEG